MFQGIQCLRELTLAQVENGEIQQQAEIVWGEDERLPIVIDGGARVAFAEQELSGDIVCSGCFREGCVGAGSGISLQLCEIRKINRIVMDRQACDVLVAANWLDLRS